MPSKIITSENKLNFDIVDDNEKITDIKQFSSYQPENVAYVPLDKVDYNMPTEEQKLPETDFEELEQLEQEPQPEINENLKNIVEKILTPEEIEKNCDNFTYDMDDKTTQLSFLNVRNEQEGAEWYRKEFPKLPDEFCEIMGRWNWGDLSQMTKKSVKNDKKKIAKGHKKTKEKYELGYKKGNFVISFD